MLSKIVFEFDGRDAISHATDGRKISRETYRKRARLAELKWGELGEWAVAHKRCPSVLVDFTDGGRDVLEIPNKVCKFKRIESGA